MLLSQFFPIALLAVASPTMAHAPCHAKVQLSPPSLPFHNASLVIATADGTEFRADSPNKDIFCRETKFQTTDPANLDKVEGSGDGSLSEPFVWRGKCSEGDEDSFK